MLVGSDACAEGAFHVDTGITSMQMTSKLAHLGLAVLLILASNLEGIAREPQGLDGLWSGSWGGGERNGVVFQPVIAEMLILGDHVEIRGFPGVAKLAG